MESNELFSFSIDFAGKKTTKYFGLLVKASSLLLMLDRYLLSNFKLKQQVSHLLISDIVADRITIKEETAYEEEAGLILQLFLKHGKELILSSFQYIETTNDLDNLLKRLSKLVYDTQSKLFEQDLENALDCSKLDKIGLARIIYSFWLYFSRSSSANPLKLESIADSPKVMFRQEPPLREWITTLLDTSQLGRLELRHVDFGNFKKWKAVIYNYLHERPMSVEVDDIKFIDSLKSTEDNAENGILHGDIIVAHYTMVNDFLRNKTDIKILKVQKRFRQTEATQLYLFADAAALELSPNLVTEKPQKNSKKKHSSWSKRRS